MELNCLVIDDKPLAIDILADYIGKVPFLKLVATTTNPVEGLSIVREQNIDLVFLDIQMPQLNGLQFIKIAGRQCKVVLTTAYSEYALDGYEHDVVDYLLKPIAFDRFYRAAEKAAQVLMISENGKAAHLFSPGNLQQANTANYLFVKTEHRIQRVNLDDILYIEGLQNYISMQTSTERIMSLQTLKRIAEQLPVQDFVRVHKSFIVALKHITYIERSRIFIGETIIPVGDSYRDAFYKLIEKS
ncbi:response regulator transcription factor [Mucilaginibacter sp. ZT4R22]|uniref:Response regulator transcription factor n=1 Tax=Mucilaginibacter pankratovii TaxID=2772110 RepID=A0ABR7WSQ1_9SPHI|nr:LytTR family DNA-binding domain-containing protein [Mucilaginibacter pankratovii]MBD1365305.1 response regulator transcription factor [Mucilaginibacter pankratovii]